MGPSGVVPLVAFLFAAQPDVKPRVSELQVALDGRRVDLAFVLENGLSDDLFERIQSGLASGFTFRFVLFRDHKRWFDKTLDDTALQVVAMYNAVEREYLVNYKQDGRLIESRVVQDRAELERAMTRFEDFHAFTLGDLDPERRLLIRARAELGSRTIFKLIPTRVTTEWVRSRKFRPPAA